MLNLFSNRGFWQLLLFSIGIGSVAHAQEYYRNTEFGVGVGVAHYFGDLNPNLGFKEIKPAVSALYKWNFNPYISLYGSVTYTQVGYKDAHSKNPYQKLRNLAFHSEIWEAAISGEFNFFWFETSDISKRWTPYLTFGVAGFYYEPTIKYGGKTVKLRTLGTEGQHMQDYKDRKYSNFSVAFPTGAGIKWWVAPGVNMSFELVNRFTLTDYIDDVSKTYVGIDNFYINPGVPTVGSTLQDPSILEDGGKMGVPGKKRGDESTSDQYFMAMLKVTFQLKTYKCPKFENNQWSGSKVNY